MHQPQHLIGVIKQRRQAAADTEVKAHAAVGSVRGPHVLPLSLGYHLQCQLVVVAEEDPPLCSSTGGWSSGEDVEDWPSILELDRHEEPGHQREVVVHVTLGMLTRSEVGGRLLGQLVGL